MIRTLHILSLLAFMTSQAVLATCLAQEKDEHLSVQEIRAILDSIDPYLPKGEVKTEIDVFGSSTMDVLAHGWTEGFAKFHPQAKVVVSAEGSETAFDRLAKNPSSVGMMSRPVTVEDLEKLKQKGLQQPVAIMVGREALGVFVNEKNPLDAISYTQLVTLFCAGDSEQELMWSALGVEGPLAQEPVDIIFRGPSSGTQHFVSDFLFRSQRLRQPIQALKSNAEVLKAVEKDPNAVCICGLKCGSHGARPLHLRDESSILPCNDHAILMGDYPLVRPLTLVLDFGQRDEQARASREFVRYALSQAGQMQLILAGFFPFDPPTLRAEKAKIEIN